MHYRDALARHEEAYRLWESALGEGDPNTITAVDELAYTYELMGDLSMAERMLKKVVQLRERFLGAYHPVTLETRELLAELHDRERKPDWEIELDGYVKGFRDLLSTGDSAGAGHLLKRISEIILYIPMPARERELGTLNVLAAECETQGRPQIQVLCAGAAVRIATQTYGPGSAQTVKFASNLAYAHAAAREFTKAIRINEECLEHRRKLFGPDHPDVALSLNNLAQIHLESGKSDLALKLTHEALRIDQHAYGETHDATAGDLHNIGIAHLKKREHAHARRFFCRAVDIWYALHPAGHMHLAIALKNLGNSYEIEGYDVAARDYYAKAYGMLKKTAGDNHPVTVKTHDALSALDARSLISDEPNPLTSVSFHTSRSRQAYTW
jgi:tetratricopeptide (TPR) repeat protein